MAQLIIDTGAAANDGTGDPLRTAFTDTNSNFTAIYTAGPVDSNVRIINNTILTINTNGNLVLAPNGIGQVVANVDVVPNTTNIRNLGGSTARWSTVYSQYANISGSLTVGGTISATPQTKASNAAGTPGQICWDADYIYVCTATDVWKRSPLTAGY